MQVFNTIGAAAPEIFVESIGSAPFKESGFEFFCCILRQDRVY